MPGQRSAPVPGTEIIRDDALRHVQRRLLGAVLATLALYGLLWALTAIPLTQRAVGAPAASTYLVIAEYAVHLLLTAALVYALYRLMGHYLTEPTHQTHAFLRLLADLADTREEATYGHAQRVSVTGLSLARAIGLSAQTAQQVGYAALLHDIGKVGVPDEVLHKAGPLNDAERAVMMAHAEMGAHIVSRAGPLAALAPMIRHHHEWWDGHGYPAGCAGAAIPVGAAIIAVADSLDTMTSGRPYRAARPLPEALAELRARAGTQFSPAVVDALYRILPPAAVTQADATTAPAAHAPVTLAEQEALARREGGPTHLTTLRA